MRKLLYTTLLLTCLGASASAFATSARVSTTGDTSIVNFENYSTPAQGAEVMNVRTTPFNGTKIDACHSTRGTCSILSLHDVISLKLTSKHVGEPPVANVLFTYRIQDLGCAGGFSNVYALYQIQGGVQENIRVLDESQILPPNVTLNSSTVCPQS